MSVEECVRSRCAGGGGGGNERDVDFVKTLQTGVVQTGGALIIKKNHPLAWASPEHKTNIHRDTESIKGQFQNDKLTRRDVKTDCGNHSCMNWLLKSFDSTEHLLTSYS